MTTFTTEDRIQAQAMDSNEETPIPFYGWLRHEPVIIVESGASVIPLVEELKWSIFCTRLWL